MADRITLDKKERLFLSNQMEILKNQQIIINSISNREESEVDTSYYDNQIKALREGFELHYEDAFEGIYDGLSIEDCKFVLDVLEMYRGITYSYMALKRDSKLNKLGDSDIAFPGFDLNTETEYYSYCKYFILDLDRYSEIQEYAGKYFDYNSHTSTTIPKYRRQLMIWQEYESLENRYLMTEDQLINLLKA